MNYKLTLTTVASSFTHLKTIWHKKQKDKWMTWKYCDFIRDYKLSVTNIFICIFTKYQNKLNKTKQNQ